MPSPRGLGANLPKERRLCFEIMIDILKAASEEDLSMTRLVSRTNSNFIRAAKYVRFLAENDYLQCFGSEPRVYRTTSKGKQAAEILAGVEKIIFRRDRGLPEIAFHEGFPFESGRRRHVVSVSA